MDRQNKISYHIAGIVFIIIPFLIQIPYTMLILDFKYPEILRQPTEMILEEFQKGGSKLIWTWWFFGFSGLPLVYSYIGLYKLSKEKYPLASLFAVTIGISALFFQLIGLMRWVFVVPVLSHIYFDANVTAMTKEAVLISFQTIHLVFGVMIGEHLGQIFTIVWMFISSVLIIKDDRFSKWITYFGIFASFLYFFAQAELFAIVIPYIPEIPLVGLFGSLSWLLWMVSIGFQMLKFKT